MVVVVLGNLGLEGLLPKAITDHVEVKQLTAYFAWSAWAGSTLRPDKDYTYTNNWPYKPLTGNHPSPSTFLWTVFSVLFMIAGIGLLASAQLGLQWSWNHNPLDSAWSLAERPGWLRT